MIHGDGMPPVGASIAILGAGLSGRAAFRLAQSLGYQAELFDQKASDARAVFNAELVQRFAACIISPGFSAEHPGDKWLRPLEKFALANWVSQPSIGRGDYMPSRGPMAKHPQQNYFSRHVKQQA